MRVRVRHDQVDSLLEHLREQGFPGVRVGSEVVDVLFPASPVWFARAAELDDWRARTGGVVEIEAEVGARSLSGEPGADRAYSATSL